MSDEILEKLANAVMAGDEEAAKKAAQEAIDAKIDPLDAIKKGLSKGMEVIGKKFANFEVFLPEVMLAADAMKAGIEVLKPHISADRISERSKGRVVIGTVYGDIHDIGKNLVATMLEVARYEVHDLGNDVPPKKFLDKAREVKCEYHRDVLPADTLHVLPEGRNRYVEGHGASREDMGDGRRLTHNP